MAGHGCSKFQVAVTNVTPVTSECHILLKWPKSSGIDCNRSVMILAAHIQSFRALWSSQVSHLACSIFWNGVENKVYNKNCASQPWSAGISQPSFRAVTFLKVLADFVANAKQLLWWKCARTYVHARTRDIRRKNVDEGATPILIIHLLIHICWCFRPWFLIPNWSFCRFAAKRGLGKMPISCRLC